MKRTRNMIYQETTESRNKQPQKALQKRTVQHGQGY